MDHTETCGDRNGGSATNKRLSRYAKARQILDMQDVLKNNVLDKNTKPLERASCARAWTELEHELRRVRGKFTPGSLNARTDAEPKRRRRPAVVDVEAVAEQMRIDAARNGNQDGAAADSSEPNAG